MFAYYFYNNFFFPVLKESQIEAFESDEKAQSVRETIGGEELQNKAAQEKVSRNCQHGRPKRKVKKKKTVILF